MFADVKLSRTISREPIRDDHRDQFEYQTLSPRESEVADAELCER
jgi:hypothetical protein